MKTLLWVAVWAAMAAVGMSAETKDYTHETAEQKAARMKWFAEARFGMFIHWGVYSVPAGEYKDQKNHAEWYLQTTKMPVSEYEKFAQQFNPVKFDADAWVALAKQAGMKYIVITSKHHDGFGMFRSQLTDWCIKSTPFPRDPLKELAAACKKQGLRFCLYHSIMDWHHPLYGQRRPWNDKAAAMGPPDMPKYVEFMQGQLRELLGGAYGPIGILWFDGGWEKCWTSHPEWAKDTYNLVRGLQPDIIVNDRLGGGVGDYGTPEQTIPGAAPKHPWESCMTLNNHWGYNKFDHHWKSPTQIVRNLIDCASKGGNYLLNVGPTSEGLIPEGSVNCLHAVGDWMKVNSAAIHDTSVSPFRKLDFGRATTRGSTLFLHVFDVPQNRVLRLPGLENKVERAYFLADPGKTKLAIGEADGSPAITLPDPLPVALDPHATVVVAELDGPAKVAPFMVTPRADGSLDMRAVDATVTGDGPAAYESGGGKDNIGYWISEKNCVQWEARVVQAGTYRVTVDFACPADSAGAEYEVSIAGQSVKGKVTATGDWAKFEQKELGTIALPAGRDTLVVKPLSKPNFAVMNLRAVRLTPVP